MADELEGFDELNEDVNDNDENEDVDNDSNDESDDNDNNDENDESDDSEDESGEDDKEPKDKDKTKDDDEKDDKKKLGVKTKYREVKEAFPELFKKFPDLKSAFFREREFASLFATVDDAKEAQAKAEFYDQLEPELLQGRSTAILKALAGQSRELVEEYSKNVLNDLHEFSPELFYKTVDPVLRQFISAAANDAKKNNNKNLYLAARYMSKFLTNDDKIPETRRNDPELDREKERLNRERSEFMNERARSFQARLIESTMPEVDEILKDEITIEDVGGDEYKYNKLLKDIFEEIDNKIKRDTQHMKYVNALHKRAASNGYQGNDIINRLRKSYVDKVRLLAPSVKARLLKEANVKPTKKNVEEKELTGQKVASSKKGLAGVDSRKIDWSKTSDQDILDGKVTYLK